MANTEDKSFIVGFVLQIIVNAMVRSRPSVVGPICVSNLRSAADSYFADR